ncbi:hypothetical protein B0H67DRAFT_115583 [Lasiosphaeris hirsuta]|uniref:Uncharacterized protein n=1 Tax=Lasiosphaeris hirsuta TaxID=260670 RepID=A0AA40AZH6_9PEZI|nr:hypothetical protein B0H67DRAFT_115583 [Lasiosphaeris hirsuta]
MREGGQASLGPRLVRSCLRKKDDGMTPAAKTASPVNRRDPPQAPPHRLPFDTRTLSPRQTSEQAAQLKNQTRPDPTPKTSSPATRTTYPPSPFYKSRRPQHNGRLSDTTLTHISREQDNV